MAFDADSFSPLKRPRTALEETACRELTTLDLPALSARSVEICEAAPVLERCVARLHKRIEDAVQLFRDSIGGVLSQLRVTSKAFVDSVIECRDDRSLWLAVQIDHIDAVEKQLAAIARMCSLACETPSKFSLVPTLAQFSWQLPALMDVPMLSVRSSYTCVICPEIHTLPHTALQFPNKLSCAVARPLWFDSSDDWFDHNHVTMRVSDEEGRRIRGLRANDFLVAILVASHTLPGPADHSQVCYFMFLGLVLSALMRFLFSCAGYANSRGGGRPHSLPRR